LAWSAMRRSLVSLPMSPSSFSLLCNEEICSSAWTSTRERIAPRRWWCWMLLGVVEGNLHLDLHSFIYLPVSLP
ncbi:hypothetical protein BGZ67_007777, partial [Mortierella alpina]